MSTATATQTTIRPAIYSIGDIVGVSGSRKQFEVIGIKLADRYVSRDIDLIETDEAQWAYLLAERGTHDDGSGDVYLVDGWTEEVDIIDRSKRVGQ